MAPRFTSAWDDITSERRKRNQRIASRAAAMAKRGTAKPRTAQRSAHAPGANPASRERVTRRRDWSVAVLSTEGWTLPDKFQNVTRRQVQFMTSMARYESLHWGAMAEIARMMGMAGSSGWSIARRLQTKFGVHSRHQLHAIAKELIRNRARSRSSTRE